MIQMRKGKKIKKEMLMKNIYGGMDEKELKIIEVLI